MRFLGIFISTMIAFGSARAQANDSSGEIAIDTAHFAAARDLATALEGAATQAENVSVDQFLSVLPLADDAISQMNVAYLDGLTAACPSGNCAIDGAGAPARAPLSSDDPALRGVSVGLRNAVSGTFKVVRSDQGTVVNFCNVQGVYFSRLIFSKNLVNFQIEDDGADVIIGRYELTGGESGQINCD